MFRRILMHTYEFECFNCGSKAKFEIYNKLDYEVRCPCGGLMILMFYLLSPDTRANKD
jgi:DNA-directed RNA polymerase subunit RPC12/RpoP